MGASSTTPPRTRWRRSWPGSSARASPARPTGRWAAGSAWWTGDPTAGERYARHLQDTSIDGRRLTGLRVVLDCSNGAGSTVGPKVLTALGADVTVIHADPDGSNINADCGSNHPESLQQVVANRRAHVGLALDGDADRLIAVDADGNVVDGDHVIAVCAVDRHERGLLPHDTVVVTVMTNLGFRQRDGRQGHHGSSRPTWATARCSRPWTRAASRSAASSQGT